ncbi:cytidine deaminase [Deinococcus yavapaiensis]|uniref:Cytidine deaminase n=1 Tax=Deinococcus yavapaiensis KR-236 TaxID=694435 RepID=A0A318SNZ5_9DEIO|nr:cytidine deaminase [Deinococcus yavapaiensis]PYE56632.1 cytidine deaminase [Deinococcus yavapaiensis KR-236]
MSTSKPELDSTPNSNVPVDETLLDLAKATRLKAYTPYSHFNVGAALRTTTGQVFFGANIENASYGLARCAEQSAVQAMASSGEREFTEIVVYTEASPPASPCGACRQILFEFSPEARLVCVNHLGETITGQVKDFLPYGFRLES